MNEFERRLIRQRSDEAADALDRTPQVRRAGPRMLVQVDGSSATDAMQYFKCTPLLMVSGGESEGAPVGNFGVGTGTILAIGIGRPSSDTGLPPPANISGTRVIYEVGGRWAFSVKDTEACRGPMTIRVTGCGSPPLNLPSAPITITDQRANVIASGMTDALGEFTFTAVDGQQLICIITAARWNRFVRAFTYQCNARVQMDLCAAVGPAPGYGCCNAFAYPLKTVLQYSDKNGTKALVYNGSGCTGAWTLCYDAPSANCSTKPGDCSDGVPGNTPVMVNFCPVPIMQYAIVGCPPLNPFGEYVNCANAPSGMVFNYENCDFTNGPYTLSCDTFPLFTNGCSDPLRINFGDRGAPYAADPTWTVLTVPPAGFAGVGNWSSACNPLTGPYAISE